MTTHVPYHSRSRQDSQARDDRSPKLTRLNRVRLAVVLPVFVACLFANAIHAQGPGDFPPISAIKETAKANSDNAPGLPIRGFMVLDELNVPIMIRDMSDDQFLELELDTDAKTQRKLYAFEDLQISGKTIGDRGEFDLRFKISIDPTRGQWVRVPLKLGNFHLLSASEFTSTPSTSGNQDAQRIGIADDGSGYVMWVRSEKRRRLSLRMKMSCKVEKETRHSITFKLPSVSTKIFLDVDMPNATAETFGNDYIHSPKPQGGGTRFEIDNTGGSRSLFWNQSQKRQQQAALLEVDGSIRLDASQKQDQLIQKVRLVIRNLRGSVDKVELMLPPGTSVLNDSALLEDTDSLATSGVTVNVQQDRNKRRATILIPKLEREQRVRVSFDLQLPRTQLSAEKPLKLSAPSVIGALRQEGEINVQTGGESRLRWRAGDWVRASLAGASDDDQRNYRFSYSRSDFDLPLWLSANQRQLRLSSETTIDVLDSSAKLESTIRFSGQTTDSLSLKIKLPEWNLLDIIDAETGEQILSERDDDTVTLELSAESDTPPPIKLVAERSIRRSNVDLAVPQLISTGRNIVLRENNVAMRSLGRSTFVVDLSKSQNLERIATSRSMDSESIPVNRYRVSPPDVASALRGQLVDQPLRIQLTSKADIQYRENQVTTEMSWAIEPKYDLGGKLPIRLVGGRSEVSPDAGWNVTVNGFAANLRSLSADGQFELISEYLGKEPVIVRWQKRTPVSSDQVDAEIQSVAVPVLDIDDVSLLRDFVVNLTGDRTADLLAADSTSGETMQFQSLPETIRVRISKRSTRQDELTVEKAVLRSAIGVGTRSEQLLARVRGGDSLRLGLPTETGPLDVEVLVDGEKINKVSRTEDTLLIALPGDSEAHVVDLRVWVNESSAGVVSQIEPVLTLPQGVGRIYWQVIVPRDSHAVWASPSLERAMEWQFDGWSLNRRQTLSDKGMADLVGVVEIAAMPPGNEYLYVGSEGRSFQCSMMSRTWLWLLVGGFILGATWMLTYLPSTRNPLTAVGAAVLFAGMLAIAPDAAVLTGQLAAIASVLVIVMFAVSVLMKPRQNRLLKPSGFPSGQDQPSRGDNGQADSRGDSQLPVTQTIDLPPSAPSEVSS